jgi:DHA1 family tetracycline resistance protein-like MFS transporter
LLYGLATQGWMMYVLILCNVLSFAIGPALQASSPSPPPRNEQGELMGSLQSISSVGVIFMPLPGLGHTGPRQPPAAQRLAHRQHVLTCARRCRRWPFSAQRYSGKHAVPA